MTTCHYDLGSPSQVTLDCVKLIVKAEGTPALILCPASWNSETSVRDSAEHTLFSTPQTPSHGGSYLPLALPGYRSRSFDGCGWKNLSSFGSVRDAKPQWLATELRYLPSLHQPNMGPGFICLLG